MVLADDFGAGQVFVDLLMFVLFFIWIWLLIVVFSDLFRSHDLSGWAKAAWVIGIVIFPYLGVLVYLIARGNKMSEHVQQAAAAQDAAARSYIQQAAGAAPSTADEIQRLAALKAQGVITDEEFEAGKAKALAP
jgi:putative oligomerization/nucleic acid binding protein/phospholipase D-like protein